MRLVVRMMSVDTVRVSVPQCTLDDLQERLRRTRWTDEIDDGWTRNRPWRVAGARRLLARRRSTGVARRKQFNRFAQFRAEVNGIGVHFVHEHGVGDDPLPIILTHGYPDSFLRFAKITPMLTHPELHGADPADAFDVGPTAWRARPTTGVADPG